MHTNLFKDLARSGWHTSILTTYSVDPAFYDGSIEYRLRNYGCENNILLADAVMLTRALTATPEAFRNAGRRYAVVPVQAPGCFHPKLHLRLGRDTARVVVGSANATAAGWGRNQEIVTAFDWSRRGAETTELGPLVRKAHDYLISWLSAVPGDAIDFKLRQIRRASPWLADLTANESPIELSDGTAVDLFCERGDGGEGMLVRLLRCLGGQPARRLVVISPYWDAGLEGLSDLRRALGFCPTIVALNPQRNAFPVDRLSEDDDLVFAAVPSGQDAHRFLHAKMILIETDTADHLLFGSANCSDDALGRLRAPARNAEVSIYQRLPPGRTCEQLGLDLTQVVARERISQQIAARLPFSDGSMAFPPGTIELVERTVTWWPAAGIAPDGAHLRIADQELPLQVGGNGQFRVELPVDPSFPMIVRVRLVDGRISDPVVVHDELALRLAAPGVTDRRISQALSRVLSGQEDIIDLAREAHVLFAPDPEEAPAQGHAHEPRNEWRSGVRQVDYATPDEFRRAVALRPATGESGRFSMNSPGLLDVLAILLRGVTDVGGREARRRREAEEERDLEHGETEDGDEFTGTQPEDAPPEDGGAPQAEDEGKCAPPPAERSFTPAEITRRRSYVKRSIDAFEKMIDHLSENPALVTGRLTVQTAFILNVMLYACTKDHRTAKGDVRLMAFVPASGSDRELCFIVRAGRMLQRIWTGGSKAPLVDYLAVDPRHGALPDDVFFLIVMTRWAMARAVLAASSTPGHSGLADVLRTSTVRIYQSTLRFGPLEPEAEQRFITLLDAGLGFAPAATDVLLGSIRQFIAEIDGRQMANASGSLSVGMG